jgi:hypothetical protein
MTTPQRARVSGARETNQRLTTEAHVQQTVVQFLELDGWRALRTDPVSDRSRGKDFGEIGMPDYLFLRYCGPIREAAYPGDWDGTRVATNILWIEFKRKGAKPKRHQVRWKDMEASRGALILLVDDIDEFTRWYKTSGLCRRIL